MVMKDQKKPTSAGEADPAQTTAPMRSIERALEILRILRETRGLIGRLT